MVASLYSPEEAQKTLWVYLEQDDGELQDISLELLAKGHELADQMGWGLAGLLLGHQVGRLAPRAIAHGAEEVWWIDHPLLKLFTIDAYAHAAFQALLQGKPSIFLLGATPNGRDLAGRLAVRLQTGLNADCTDLRIEPGEGILASEVSGFGGGVLAMIQMRSHRPQMATVRPGVFSALEADTRRSGEVLRFNVDLPSEIVQTRIVERQAGQGVNLSRVPILVAGGRGMEGDFKMLKELADLLGGEVGATRPPVDEGYVERERQIGQTGVVCSPKIAICCGISGAFHFVVGIDKASIVIAINSDPEAPIFDYADYCIVGDVHQLVPALMQALQIERQAAYA